MNDRGSQWSRPVALARDLLGNPPDNVPRFTYYSSIARELSAGTLARAGVRRAYRAAKRLAYRPSRTAPPGLLRAFEPATEKLVEQILESPERPAWSDVSRRLDVLSTLRRSPGAIERAIARAERSARREFDLFGTSVAFGAGACIDWSLDPLSGYRYSLAPSRSLRLDAPGVDPKYPWALGRLDQLLALGQGYWACAAAADRERFAAEFIAQSEDFIRSNPAALGVHWTSPMEVALRAANLAFALSMFRDSPPVRDPRFVLLVLQSLVEHGRFVEAHLENGGAVPNNHLVANHLGLLVLGTAFPELPPARRWAGTAARSLRALIEVQVHPDGYSFEGSTSYHRLAVELFALSHVCAAAGGIDLGPVFRERLGRMFHVAGAYCSDQGFAPQIGDNDSGRVFPLRDRDSLDHGYLAALGAALLGDPALKLSGADFPDEAAWLLGRGGWEKFQSLPSGSPPASFGSPKGGLYLFRGAGGVVAVSAGPQGQNGIGGHNHNDQLSFELHIDGIPAIVDIGTGTYLRDAHLRDSFRATAAHNTLQLDGREQARLDRARPFALPSSVPTTVERFEAGDPRIALVARRADSPGTNVQRALVLNTAERALWISDRVTSSSCRRAVGRLHLRDREVRIREVSTTERLRGERACDRSSHFGQTAAEIGRPDAPLAVVVFGAGLEIRIDESQYSPGYGEVQPAASLVYSVDIPRIPVLTVVVLFGERQLTRGLFDHCATSEG
jgi:hypothetical protein